ncbi:MAG: hypothetical protein ACR2QA_01495, partial [Solirubrobacteraceae bacterium]
MANYSPNQIVYGGDLDRFNTKWWTGDSQSNQAGLLQQGYHFLPGFNTGYYMRAEGYTSIPASTTKQDDPHSCIDVACGLNTGAILSEVQGVQHTLGGGGNYYSVGNEPEDAFSDDVSPSV